MTAIWSSSLRKTGGKTPQRINRKEEQIQKVGKAEETSLSGW
jgi:hypothetical protein